MSVFWIPFGCCGRSCLLHRTTNASHAVGTTVRVSEFLHCLPVRKEVCLKQASKSLQNIKETLQAYAVARPCIRFSLKVLGAKNDKANWSYAPKKNATMADAALCIFGRAVSSQCTPYPPLNGRGERSPPLTMSHDELSESVETEFKIEAYLPRPGSGRRLVLCSQNASSDMIGV